MRSSVTSEMFRKEYADVFTGDEHWRALPIPEGDLYAWDEKSTYIKNPPYFEGMPRQARRRSPICTAFARSRVLGDSVTTDHISPAGSIPADSPRREIFDLSRRPAEGFQFLRRAPRQSRSDDARHIRQHSPAQSARARHRRRLDDPSARRRKNVHLRRRHEISRRKSAAASIIAGKEYGSGSSRDWAAKGTILLGVRAVLAESFERIHRSNLVGMGVLPLEFHARRKSEIARPHWPGNFRYRGSGREFRSAQKNEGHRARSGRQSEITSRAMARVDTPFEVAYYQHGGILQYVLRQML